jgi:hypothetical protein
VLRARPACATDGDDRAAARPTRLPTSGAASVPKPKWAITAERAAHQRPTAAHPIPKIRPIPSPQAVCCMGVLGSIIGEQQGCKADKNHLLIKYEMPSRQIQVFSGERNSISKDMFADNPWFI